MVRANVVVRCNDPPVAVTVTVDWMGFELKVL
jgi:hypothetical protein